MSQLQGVSVPLSKWICALLAPSPVRIISNKLSLLRISFFSAIGNFLLGIDLLFFAEAPSIR